MQSLLSAADIAPYMVPLDIHPPGLEPSQNLICGSPIPIDNALTEAVVGYGQPIESGTVVFERVVEYGPGVSPSMMQSARAKMNDCTEWTESGAANPYTVTAIQPPIAGDDVLGFRVHFDPTSKWAEDVIALRIGNLIAWITYGDSNQSLLSGIIRHAASELHQ